MNWLLLTIASALTGSLTRILQKVLLKNKDSDPFAFGFVFQLVVALLFLSYALFTKTLEFPDLSGIGLNILILALFYSLGNVLTFKAFKVAEASEVSVIFASNSVWSVLAAIIMLGEKLTTKNIFGIVLVVLGVAAINFSRSRWQINKGHLYALLGAMLFGIAFTNDAYIISRYNSISSYMILAFTLPALATLGFKPRSIGNINQYLNKKTIPSLLFCAVFYALSALTIFTAYKTGGPASIISPIQQTNIIFTVVISYFLLKEKDRLFNKVLGAVLVFAGVLLLV
ncbi:MAG: DMT family transporter [Patescibacteria group bacterium]